MKIGYCPRCLCEDIRPVGIASDMLYCIVCGTRWTETKKSLEKLTEEKEDNVKS